MTKEESLTEVLRKASEMPAGEPNGHALRVSPSPEEYAPVPTSVPPEARDTFRQLTLRGEQLASYYERQAVEIIEHAQTYALELRKLAEQIRSEAGVEAERSAKFINRIMRLGDTLSQSWKENPEGL